MEHIGALDEDRVPGHGFDPGDLFLFAQFPGLGPTPAGSLVLGHGQDQLEHLVVGDLANPFSTVGIGDVFEIVVEGCGGEHLVRRAKAGEDGHGPHEVGDVRDVVVGERSDPVVAGAPVV